jgi:hypothetical protein
MTPLLVGLLFAVGCPTVIVLITSFRAVARLRRR